MFENLVLKNRSYRRFYQDHIIDMDSLKAFVNLARQTASAGNKQPLKYILVNQPEQNADIFSCLAWAGYLKDWSGPSEGERPSAYIIILGDNDISQDLNCDHGITAQTIMLAATEKGLGGCMIGNIKRKKLKQIFNISDRYEIPLILALGKPKEEVVIEEIPIDGDIKYWRDEMNKHHVPKRKLSDVIIGIHEQ